MSRKSSPSENSQSASGAKIFDWRRYRNEYNDLSHLSTISEVCQHYLIFGRYEHRRAYVVNTLRDRYFHKYYTRCNENDTVDDFVSWCESANSGIGLSDLVLRLPAQPQEKRLFQACDRIVLSPELDLFQDLSKIYSNIDAFMKSIQPFTNILFISGDVPGYGGSSTLCDKLHKFIRSNHHTTRALYVTYDGPKDIYTGTSQDSVCDVKDIYTTLEKITESMKPDLIILKSPLQLDHSRFNQCPVFFLMGGIYSNLMNRPYHDLTYLGDHVQHINQDVIRTIRMCKKSYSSCAHTSEILKKCFDMDVDIFHSTFVSFYGRSVKSDPLFGSRQYNYALIVSNFDRPIKNVAESIRFLADKSKVLLIGENSYKYAHVSSEFECRGLMCHDELLALYPLIKYVRQDSHYESCSNVEVEARFSGCVMSTHISKQNIRYLDNCTTMMTMNESYYPESKRKIKMDGLECVCRLYPIQYDVRFGATQYLFRANEKYVVGNISRIYQQTISDHFSSTSIGSVVGAVIDTSTVPEFAFLVQVTEDTSITLDQLFKLAIFTSTRIGSNTHHYDIAGDNDTIVSMYRLYGKYRVPIKYVGLELFYDEYITHFSDSSFTASRYVDALTGDRKSFNKKMTVLCLAYFAGRNSVSAPHSFIREKMNGILFHTKRVLLLSKRIFGYGGVQKTSEQLVESLDYEYDICVISQELNKTVEYDFLANCTNPEIPHCLIAQCVGVSEIEAFINSTPFDIIINNKLNQAVDWNINQKLVCLSHNSMDVFNELIRTNASKIRAVYTINQFHRRMFTYNTFSAPVCIYRNYCRDELKSSDKVSSREAFTYKVAFIGRFSKGKNVQELIDGVNLFNRSRDGSCRARSKITLYVVGSGNITYTNITHNIILTGYYTSDQITTLYNSVDYIVSASVTEGKPFSVIDALSSGIPCIHSNIAGIDEIIFRTVNGFLFDFSHDSYAKIKADTNFDRLQTIYNADNKIQIAEILDQAYSITIEEWNKMSVNSRLGCDTIYSKKYCVQKNLHSFETLINSSATSGQVVSSAISPPFTKIKIFINFKPNPLLPYGGGNISIYYLVSILGNPYSDFEIVYELSRDIDIYLIVDPFKDRVGFKKYSLEDIVSQRLAKNVVGGKIVVRINDCDITRPDSAADKSRENEIIKYYKHINYFIFNSQFIRNYYFAKLKTFNLAIPSHNYSVILNGCDQTIFTNNPKTSPKTKLKIITHHWSNNMNKGYQLYHDLWKYSQTDVGKAHVEFYFIGKNVPEMFSDVPIIGPLVSGEINAELNKNHVYITDSRFDSCPNHILEAISCGLPILYSNVEGGVKELCTAQPELKIGEMYNDFDELIVKIELIRKNYSTYRRNVSNAIEFFNIRKSISNYYSVCAQLRSPESKNNKKVNLLYKHNVITVTVDKSGGYFVFNNVSIKLVRGTNVFVVNKATHQPQTLPHIMGTDANTSVTVYVRKFTPTEKQSIASGGGGGGGAGAYKLTNDKPNILLCSDRAYLVGLFAALHSVVSTSNYVSQAHFNFIVPLDCCQTTMANMLIEFQRINDLDLDISLIYLDKHILSPVFFKSKCFNGGGHLLNVGNVSRMLIGEFMAYPKLLYLDSDSIVQYDVIEKLMRFDVNLPIYASRANIVHENSKKQVVIKLSSIIDDSVDWTDIIGTPIDATKYAFMGAPFIANCSMWEGVYAEMVRIISLHNAAEKGIYKLFTMSLQNIIFYNRTGNINTLLSTLQDLGSMRKSWKRLEIVGKDVLDWSGMHKPWFKNGLHRHLWISHDCMHLSDKIGNVDGGNKKKHVIETYSEQKALANYIESPFIRLSRDNPTAAGGVAAKADTSTSADERFKAYLANLSHSTTARCVSKTDNGANINVLYVCNVDFLRHKMSRVRFWVIEELSKRTNVALTLTGPGFSNFDATKSLQQNIIGFDIPFDLVMWYKPLDPAYNFDRSAPKLPFKTCLRYNEMWNVEWTMSEIAESRTDLIICHHSNDYDVFKQKSFPNNPLCEFAYIPHCSNTDIFHPIPGAVKDIDVMISGITKNTHYPLKHRLEKLFTNPTYKHKLQKLNVVVYTHPGYSNKLSFENVNQIAYNKIINRSKLCVACTSKYKYRLGKYVEIPMAGGVIAGDVPESDGVDDFSQFVVEITDEMSDDQILHTVFTAFNSASKLDAKRTAGLTWAAQYSVASYVDTFLTVAAPRFVSKFAPKIFIISDDLPDNHAEFKSEKWICDVLKREFAEFAAGTSAFSVTTDAMSADIVWFLAPWNFRFTPEKVPRQQWLDRLAELKTRKNSAVLFTQHHIDPTKLAAGQLDAQFETMNKYGTRFHAICDHTLRDMRPHFPPEKTSSKLLWVNSDIYFPIGKTIAGAAAADPGVSAGVRAEYGFDPTDYLVGSFQKDTEGNTRTNRPKLSKGPDLFVEIVADMYAKNNRVKVVLTGLRREYIIAELVRRRIPYAYFNMVPLPEINKLYSCLDLYVVSSRCEGGPRAVFECGLTRTPIISTAVGVSTDLLNPEAIFDHADWKTYKDATPDPDAVYKKVESLRGDKYLDSFGQYLVGLMNG